MNDSGLADRFYAAMAAVVELAIEEVESSEPKIVSAAQAREKGSSRYFTGKPCKYGHVAEKFLKSMTCVVCDSEKTKRRWIEQQEHMRLLQKQRSAKFFATHPEEVRTWQKEYREENREVRRSTSRRSARKAYAADPEKFRAVARDRARKYPEVARALSSRRRKGKRLARCACCTTKDFARVFHLARTLAGEVDHIEPLGLGGAHCVKNLQVLSPEAHKEKTRHDKDRMRRAGLL